MSPLGAHVVVDEPVGEPGGPPGAEVGDDRPGVLSVQRWRSADGKTCLTLDLATEPGDPVVVDAPDTTREGRTSVYRCVQLHPGGLVAPADAGHLYLVRLRPDPAIEEEWNRWYSEEHVPSLAGVAGVLCARRFRAQNPDRLGRRYLAMYHMTAPDVPRTREWKQASDSPWTRRMKPHHQAGKVLDVFGRVDG
ncbi:hypothetical protein ACI8AF_06430 [Blastococcus sp. SYSU D00669]